MARMASEADEAPHRRIQLDLNNPKDVEILRCLQSYPTCSSGSMFSHMFEAQHAPSLLLPQLFLLSKYSRQRSDVVRVEYVAVHVAVSSCKSLIRLTARYGSIETRRQKQYAMGAEALSVGDVPKAATHLAVFFHLLGTIDEKKEVLQGWRDNLSTHVFRHITDAINRLEASAMVEINPAEELALTLATIMLSYTASVPFEVVKLTLQSQPELMRRGSISPWEPLAGPADCFQRRVFTKTGLRAIWATDFLGVAMVVPRHVVSKGCDVIAMAPALQRWVPGVLGPDGLLAHVGLYLRYVVPGVLSQAATHAIQVVRTRVAVGERGGSGPFYTSFSFAYSVFNSVVLVKTALVFQSVLEHRNKTDGGTELERRYPWGTEVALTVAKDVLAALIMFPLDTARRRVMLAPVDGAERGAAGVLQCAVDVYRTEGMGALFSGWSMCVLQTAVSSVVMAIVSGPIRKAYISFKTKQKQVELARARARVRQAQLNNAAK